MFRSFKLKIGLLLLFGIFFQGYYCFIKPSRGLASFKKTILTNLFAKGFLSSSRWNLDSGSFLLKQERSLAGKLNILQVEREAHIQERWERAYSRSNRALLGGSKVESCDGMKAVAQACDAILHVTCAVDRIEYLLRIVRESFSACSGEAPELCPELSRALDLVLPMVLLVQRACKDFVSGKDSSTFEIDEAVARLDELASRIDSFITFKTSEG